MSGTSSVGIFYHTDPAGHVPGGIDSFIRGILQWAPPDLEYTLYGASTDLQARPLGSEVHLILGARSTRYVPVVDVCGSAGKRYMPDTLRYMRGLRRWVLPARLAQHEVLDFQRIEPLWLFRRDPRPKNLVLHQDMSVLRDPRCDIKWKHAPWAYEFIESHSFDLVQTVSVVRESAVDRYRRLYPRQADKFRFLPTWYEDMLFRPQPGVARASLRAALAAEHGLSDGPLLIAVGRLDSQKDPLLLLEAVAMLRAGGRPAEVLLVGDGVLRTAVAERAARDDLRGHAALAGAVPRTRIADMLRAADLFVMASAYEGMPIAVLEALGSGVPVVSTDVGELRRLVSDGVNGQLATARTPQALADALAQALARAPDSAACVRSVAPYRPQQVLGTVYDLHRRLAQQWRSAA